MQDNALVSWSAIGAVLQIVAAKYGMQFVEMRPASAFKETGYFRVDPLTHDACRHVIWVEFKESSLFVSDSNGLEEIHLFNPDFFDRLIKHLQPVSMKVRSKPSA